MKKPLPEEFYDVAVQNENMDIIDEELKKLSVIGENIKPEDIGAAKKDHSHTAEEVGAASANTHNIKTYCLWSQLGLSEPDVKDIATIVNAMPDRSIAMLQCNTSSTANGVVPQNYGVLLINKISISFAYLEYSGGVTRTAYYGHYNATAGDGIYWSGWKEISNASHDHLNSSIKPANIEFIPPSGQGYGGFIDFHYNGGNGTEDYTSRIIELTSGQLTVSAPNGVLVTNALPNVFAARTIGAHTDAIVAGSTALGTGAIYLQYE